MHVCPICVNAFANIIAVCWSWGVHCIAYAFHFFFFTVIGCRH